MKINIHIILSSIVILTILGCTHQPSKEEKRAKLLSKNEFTADIETKYRQRLYLLNIFKTKVPMPFNFIKKVDGNCSQDEKITEKQLCIDYNDSEQINICNDKKYGIKKFTIIKTKLDNNISEELQYECNNKQNINTGNKIPIHYIFEDKKYISIGNFTNKLEKFLPIDFNLVIKNTINTIGKNYILIDISNDSKNNEYRIEGAVTLNEVYNRDKSNGTNIYSRSDKEKNNFNFDFNKNNSSNVMELLMDFIVKKYNSSLNRWEYVRNVSTTRKAIITKTAKGYDITFGIYGGGVSFVDNQNFSDSLYYASKYLIESSMVELLAKLDDLPYWSFLPPKKTNLEKDKNMTKEYIQEYIWRKELLSSYSKKLKMKKEMEGFSNYLKSHFIINLLNIYYGNDNIVTEKNLSQRIKEYKKYFFEKNGDFAGDIYSDKVDARLIVHLLEHTPQILLNGINRDRQKNDLSFSKINKKD